MAEYAKRLGASTVATNGHVSGEDLPASVKRPISQNTPFTKFDPPGRTRTPPAEAQDPPDFVAQDENAKSIKAEIVQRIARLVRREGLTYEEWRYVARRVRQVCGLRPRKKSRRLPRILTEEGFRRFYRAVDQAADVQHALMLRLLFYTGVRVSELCNIRVEDVDLDTCKVRIDNGKVSKDRFVLFGKSFATALRTHLAAHPKNRSLFQTRRNAQYTPRRVQQIVKQYATAAGVTATPHTFRHQAITWLTKPAGMAETELQLITGHARRETLAINLHVAYFNSCWRPGKMRITPAMAAKVTDRLWSFDHLLAA